MKKAIIKKIFKDIKYKLVSSDLSAIAESFREEGRNSRDFIEVKTIAEVFEEMAKERSENIKQTN